MAYRGKASVVLALILAATPGIAQDPPEFRPGPASSYPSHQTIGKVQFAAVRFESDEECKRAFGKVNPNEYGILPVYFVIQNGGDETLLLDRMQVRYQIGRQGLDPVPARDLPSVIGPKRPNSGPTVSLPFPLPKKKNPLKTTELETREFTARTILKGDTAQGFLYFLTRHQRSAILFVRGIREGGSGQEMFFAEIPIDSATQP